MDQFTVRKLNLTPRSNQELHSVLTGFELKWQNKVRNLQSRRSDRISRF